MPFIIWLIYAILVYCGVHSLLNLHTIKNNWKLERPFMKIHHEWMNFEWIKRQISVIWDFIMFISSGNIYFKHKLKKLYFFHFKFKPAHILTVSRQKWVKNESRSAATIITAPKCFVTPLFTHLVLYLHNRI